MLHFFNINTVCVCCLQVYENCPVNSIDVQVDDFGTRRVHSVHTEKGSIRTDKVINCAGDDLKYTGS